MPTAKSKGTKRRTNVKELPKKQKTLKQGDLKRVKGGAISSTGSSGKTAQKNFDAMDAIIRG